MTDTPKPPPPKPLTFTEVMRTLRIMQLEIETYRSAIPLGSERELRLRAIDKAIDIVERYQYEHAKGRR